MSETKRGKLGSKHTAVTQNTPKEKRSDILSGSDQMKQGLTPQCHILFYFIFNLARLFFIYLRKWSIAQIEVTFVIKRKADFLM